MKHNNQLYEGLHGMLNSVVGCSSGKEVVNGYFLVLVFLICKQESNYMSLNSEMEDNPVYCWFQFPVLQKLESHNHRSGRKVKKEDSQSSKKRRISAMR